MISTSSYQQLDFEFKVNDAIKTVERLLDIERHPILAGKVEHNYGSKYALVDATTNVALIAYLNVFDKMGLDSSVLKWIDKSKATTIRFKGSTNSEFEKEVKVDVPVATLDVKEHTKHDGTETDRSKVSKVVHHVTEFHYKVHASWSISVFSGSNVKDMRVINSRTSSTTIVTQSKERFPHQNNYPAQDLSLTWLLQQIDTQNLASQFKINTDDIETRTPRRNVSTQNALDFSNNFSQWSSGIRSFFTDSLVDMLLKWHDPACPDVTQKFPREITRQIHREYSIFNPILPIMDNTIEHNPSEVRNESEEENKSVVTIPYPHNNDADDAKKILRKSDFFKLLNEQVRTIEEAIDFASKNVTSQGDNIISSLEVSMVLLTLHATDLVSNYNDSMSYVESMLEEQLIKAIGKRLTAKDLENYITFHNAKFLSRVPTPFSHSLRRPEHYPVGLLSIEDNSCNKNGTIYSHSRVVNVGSTFNIPLNAATKLEVAGDQILHGWLRHKFGSGHECLTEDSVSKYQLAARARQFSSFVLVVGTMTGPLTMEPKDAIIVQNKDEVFIPLILNELPTAGEFKDAVKSLSPEQQRFAQAYRSMQLASSVFGVCVIQIKPQLESLLGLPPDSLDKEMKLTQDLMELFVEYQVPSDLLSYNGVVDNVAIEDKVSNVRKNVKNVLDVIDDEKQKQLNEAALKTEMATEDAFQKALQHGTGFGAPAPKQLASNMLHRRLACAPRSTRIAVAKFDQDELMTGMSSCVSEMGTPADSNDMVMSGQGSYSMTQATNQIEAEINPAEMITLTEYASSPTITQHDGPTASPRGMDFTLLPKKLDVAVEQMGKNTSLRSTILKTGDTWIRNRQANLLTGLKKQNLNDEEIKNEKNKAFDLLDGLSRSGSLPIKYSELHVVVAVTHCFEKDLMETVICDNINPIEKIELSTLLFASAIHGVPARDLIKDSNDLNRLEGSMPALLQLE